MTCTFFGHSDTPPTVREQLKDTLITLIETRGADLFYIGNHGGFDRMAEGVLRELSAVYPHIKYYVVLAYLPTKPGSSPTLFPEGVETVSKRLAINFRNKWMVENSDLIVAYVNRSYGGAQQFTALAERRKKRIINLAPNAEQ